MYLLSGNVLAYLVILRGILCAKNCYRSAMHKFIQYIFLKKITQNISKIDVLTITPSINFPHKITMCNFDILVKFNLSHVGMHNFLWVLFIACLQKSNLHPFFLKKIKLKSSIFHNRHIMLSGNFLTCQFCVEYFVVIIVTGLPGTNFPNTFKKKHQ